jgi:diguanylate cyclase (GGDEF)-like protein
MAQSFQHAVSRLRLKSIRGQILAFALLAALVPSLVTSVISYVQNRRALTEKITHELVTAGSQARREVDVWLNERLYDLRVFASSHVVSESLARRGVPNRLEGYLGSVRARLSDYEELQLVDAEGRLVASSARGARAARLPEGWRKMLESSRVLVGEPYWDDAARQMIVNLGVAVEHADGRPAGALVARTNMAGVAQVLQTFASRTSGRVYLATATGRLIADSYDGAAGRTAPALEPRVVTRLLAAEGRVIGYDAHDGSESMGSARRLSRVAWLAVAEMPTAEAYRQVTRLRNVTLAVVGVLLLIVGLIAYRLATLIARPLGRLTRAASKVSAGDLAVELPPGGSGEAGYLTQVFNAMVASLRNHRAELERLSTTDALTGLINRRHLTTVLAGETERSRRNGQPYSLLMLDVDHFKKYNDSHGHQAGDEVLARIGVILHECIRAYDAAARYGGEEFLVMLSATGKEEALNVAERIRQRVGAEPFRGGRVTMSIGVAQYPTHGDSSDKVIGKADAALYAAKRAGRDQVAYAGEAE